MSERRRTALCCLNPGRWPCLPILRGSRSICPFGVAVTSGGLFLPARIVSEPEIIFIFIFLPNSLWGAPMRRRNARHWYIVHERNKVSCILAALLLECRGGWGLRIRCFHGIPPWASPRRSVVLAVCNIGTALPGGQTGTGLLVMAITVHSISSISRRGGDTKVSGRDTS